MNAIIKSCSLPFWLMTGLVFMTTTLSAQTYQIVFNLDMRQEKPATQIGVRGNLAPLSWEKTFYLKDEDQDGVFTGLIHLKSSAEELQYKFVRNEKEYELNGEDNRSLRLNHPNLEINESFNQIRPLSAEELAKIHFDKPAIQEDIAVLKRALQVVHPNLYRYTDSLQLEQEFALLEQQLINENDLPSAYKYITQLIAKIKCSHTIVNPWNQRVLIKRAFHFQNDKLPFTFKLINGRMFIDRNASEDQRLQSGVEVLSINDVGIEQIIQRLTPYISADGSNDAKRINELQLTGVEKYNYFDIVFPLGFPVDGKFRLTLQDHKNGQTLKTEVSAMTKIGRSDILQQRYKDFQVEADDLWQFEILNSKTAYLKLGTFGIWEMKMDWKQFLQNAFDELRQQEIPNLIIDIRGNVGGMDEVYQFIALRLIQQPVDIPQLDSKVGYQRIPEDLKPYLSTWDDSAYDFGDQVIRQSDGSYLLQYKDKKNTSYKARKDGYKGRTFLMTDASNSSATHHMATLFKKYKLATLVGQATGGNQNGTNGGQIFFTTLPNTQIEIDIPIYGRYTVPGTPDKGVEPDVPVAPNAEDFIRGIDTEMEAILKIIGE